MCVCVCVCVCVYVCLCVRIMDTINPITLSKVLLTIFKRVKNIFPMIKEKSLILNKLFNKTEKKKKRKLKK